MKSPVFTFLGSLFLAATLQAQAPASAETLPSIKVDRIKANVIEQPTPDFSVGNTKGNKRWRAKNWVEVDVEFHAKLAPKLKGTYPEMQVSVFLVLQKPATDGKMQVLEAKLDLVNISEGENHVLAFVSPSAMKLITEKDIVIVNNDVRGWGVDFFAEGQRVGGDTSLGKGPWWEEKKDQFNFLQGMLLGKAQTPFAPLWGDYDVPVKAKQ